MLTQDLVVEYALSLLQAIARSAGAFLRYLFVHILINLVLFNVGRATLLALTVGHYPRGRSLVAHEGRISAVGVVVTILVWCGIALFNYMAKSGGGA